MCVCMCTVCESCHERIAMKEQRKSSERAAKEQLHVYHAHYDTFRRRLVGVVLAVLRSVAFIVIIVAAGPVASGG